MADKVADRAGRQPASGGPGPRPAGTAERGLKLAALENELVQAGGGSTHGRETRLLADAALVRHLRHTGFSGDQYQRFMEQLMTYGWNVIGSWCKSGEIFSRARAFGRPVPEAVITSTWGQDDRDEVTTETIVAGAKFFRRHALVKGIWRPEGGASLPTYYVGACLLTFKTEYQRWHSHNLASHRQHLAGDDAEQALAALPDQRAVDPIDAAVLKDQVTEALSHITDPKVLEGLILRASGFTQAQAAEHVGLSNKALESRLGRARARLRHGSPSESVNN
ncbi:sigma-70 family RNA polymerase sigma factor [Kitasatospora sp. NPDC048298]|uniref:sigma-70 family RNA polymerase sigma factor n=1 Tax=Kitasatospora sp. NPDC048298 TaxID=3364049 RepID=UPI00371C51F7